MKVILMTMSVFTVQAVTKAKLWIRMIWCERRKMESILSPICKMSLKCFFSL